MKTNLSGLNDAKFQVKTCIQSILYSYTFAKMEFLVVYGGHQYRYGLSCYLTTLNNKFRGHKNQTTSEIAKLYMKG